MAHDAPSLAERWQYGRVSPCPATEPDSWQLVRLTEIAKLESGHTPSRRHPEYWDEGVPWVSLHDSKHLDREFIHSTAQTISRLGLANSSARLLPAGTVVFSRTATVGKSTILGREMATSQDFANYVCGPRLHNRFLMHLFRHLHPEWKRLMAGSTHNTIYMPVFENLELLLPPLPEQRKIADILSSVDEAIDRTEVVIDQLGVVKKAMMQELLTKGLPGRHTRFKKTEIGMVPEEWEVVSLGEALESIDSGWSPKCGNEPAQIGHWGVLKVSAVTAGSYRDTENKALPPGLAPRPLAEVKPGDVVLARANGVLDLVGRTVLVRSTRPQLMLSDKLLRLRPHPSRLTGPFLNLAMATDAVRSRLLATTGGSHMRNVSQANLRDLLLPLPSLNEQEQIAQALCAMDERAEQELAASRALRAVKSALMSVLLTGKMRVTPDEDAG